MSDSESLSEEDEAEDQDRMRDLLASYYGMNGGADAPPPPPSSQQLQSTESSRGSNHSRGNSSSSGGNYNNAMSAGRGQPAPQWQIDSSSFDAPGYVTHLLRTAPLETLLVKDDELVHQVKGLDSDMQMLVYENYNKFISATDTIRKMKGDVETMETEMDQLVSRMDKIADKSSAVNSSLAGKRNEIDKLVRVRRLLQRLEFVVVLPEKLAAAVAARDYASAVKYHLSSAHVLAKYSHVPSFKHIAHRANATIDALKVDLETQLLDPASNARPSEVATHASLLLQLGSPPAPLRQALLRACRLHFTASLEEAATAAANGDLGESSEEEEEDGEGDENKDGENDDDDASSSGDSCGASASSGNDDVGGGSSSTSRDEAKALKREVEAERKEVAKFAAAQRKAHEKTRAKEEAKQDAANGGGRHALLEAKVAMVADALVPGMEACLGKCRSTFFGGSDPSLSNLPASALSAAASQLHADRQQAQKEVEALVNDLSGAFFQAVKGLFDTACEPTKDESASHENNDHLQLEERQQQYSSSAFGSDDDSLSLVRSTANKEPAGAAAALSVAAAEATVAALARVVAAADALEKAATTACVPVYMGDLPQALSLSSSSVGVGNGHSGSGGASSNGLGLRDGAAELVEAVVRSELEVAFLGLRKQTLFSLRKLHAQHVAAVRMQMGWLIGEEGAKAELGGAGNNGDDEDDDDEADSEAGAAAVTSTNAHGDADHESAAVEAQRKLGLAFLNGEKVNLPSVLLSGFEHLLRAVEPLLTCGRTVLKDPDYGPVFGNVAAHHAWLLMAWLLAATESLCDVTLREDPTLVLALGPDHASDATQTQHDYDDQDSDHGSDDGVNGRKGRGSLTEGTFFDTPSPLQPDLPTLSFSSSSSSSSGALSSPSSTQMAATSAAPTCVRPAFVLACASLAQNLLPALGEPADDLLHDSGCLSDHQSSTYSRGGHSSCSNNRYGMSSSSYRSGGGVGGSGSGGLGGDQELEQRALASASRLTTFHAEAVGGALGLILQEALHAPFPLASGGAGGAAAHTSACAVRPSFLTVARTLDAAALEAGLALGLLGGPQGRTPLLHSSSNANMGGSGTGLQKLLGLDPQALQKGGDGRDVGSRSNSSGGGGSGSGGGGFNRDIERMFTERVVVFSDSSSDAPPQLRVPSLLLAVVKVALKALHEATRLTTFQSPAAYQQLQLDCRFLRVVLAYFLADASLREVADSMLDEVLVSAADRCTEDPAGWGLDLSDGLRFVAKAIRALNLSTSRVD